MYNQILRSKYRFLHILRTINLKSKYKYYLRRPDKKPDIFKGMSKELWFYHSRCHKFFKMRPHSFYQKYTRGSHKKHFYCPICNSKYIKRIISISSKRSCRGKVMITKQTALKIKHQHLKVGKRIFLKRFQRLPWSNNYSLIAPSGHKEKYNGYKHKIWIYHKLCHHFTYKTPANILESKKSKLHIICSYCLKPKLQTMLHHGNFPASSKDKRVKSNSTFLKEVYSQPDNKNHQYVPLSTYHGNRKTIPWLHWTTNIKPHVFYVSPDEFLNAHTRCKCQERYLGEQFAMSYLDSYGLRKNIDYYHSYIFHTSSKLTHCLHADIFIPELHNNHYTNGVAIEYDGVQHFMPIDYGNRFQILLRHHKYYKAGSRFLLIYHQWLKRAHNDHRKDKYCKKHHIFLIRIEHYSTTESVNYDKRIVKHTLNKLLLPILYNNYLNGVIK